MSQHILHKRMVCVEHQCLPCSSEHAHVHAAHAVHLHHILHTAGVLGYGNHGSHARILHLLDLDVQLVIVQGFLKYFCQLLGCFLELLVVFLYLFLERSVKIRINAQELEAFLFLLHMRDKRAVYGGRHDDCVNSLFLKHVDVLALFLFIGHIENSILMLFLVLIQAVLKSQVFALQVLVQDEVSHLLSKLLILDIAELDEGCNVIPVFLIIFPVCLAHAGQLVCYLLRDVIRYLLHEAVILKGTSGHVKRQIRAVDDAL